MEIINKAAGIIIKDRKLLVERSKGKSHFIAPGGSIEKGETPKEALIRELDEEFTIITEEKDFDLFGEFEAPAAGQEDKMVNMKVYKVAKWAGTISPASEVEEIAWVTSDNPDNLVLGSIFEHEVIPRLKQQDLID